MSEKFCMESWGEVENGGKRKKPPDDDAGWRGSLPINVSIGAVSPSGAFFSVGRVFGFCRVGVESRINAGRGAGTTKKTTTDRSRHRGMPIRRQFLDHWKAPQRPCLNRV
jgi:hypothetical protein